MSLRAQAAAIGRRHHGADVSEHAVSRFPTPLLKERSASHWWGEFAVVEILPMAARASQRIGGLILLGGYGLAGQTAREQAQRYR
jgi:hypothetical protein